MQGLRIRAARKSEWLKCALAQHFNPDPGVENEIVVLATGVDQYLQEVFHHLAFYNGDNLVTNDDFKTLCLVLGISKCAVSESEDEDICSRLPLVLNFKEFHARLCEFFSIKALDGRNGARLPVSEETEHIEREIRLRHPRVRRRKCVSFDLSGDHLNRRRFGRESVLSQDQDQSAVGCRKTTVSVLEHLELENASLRELVEDLRSSLQSSDARCMALEVALHRKQVPLQHTPAGTSERPDCMAELNVKTKYSKHTERERRRSTKDLLRELELIRASRDGQLEEAMRFNQRLEEELMGAYGELGRMQEMVESVRRENARIKKRAEEARGALAAGLESVRALQDQVQQTERLQEQVQRLEERLEMFRTQCTCREMNVNRTVMHEEIRFSSPRGHPEVFSKRDEGLQRSVEGRAASDEEEEERSVDEGQCCLLEVKRLINRLHSCAKGCQKTAICHWLVSQSSAHSRELHGSAGLRNVRGRVWIPGADEGNNESIKKKEADGLRTEVQLVETERMRCSLMQLQHKRISRRALGKILIDTLDQCSRKSHDFTPVFQLMETLCQQLLSSDLLDGGEEVSIGLTSGQRKTSILMSC